MSALNFMAWLAPAIEAGTKPHTIRARRKRPIREGEMLHLFIGMRTPCCERLFRTPCIKVEPITLLLTRKTGFEIEVAGRRLPDDEASRLMLRDGFSVEGDFIAYFLRRGVAFRRPFRGDLIWWNPQDRR